MTADQQDNEDWVTAPVNTDEERQRLIDEAEARGVDPDEALRVAEGLAPGSADADDFRFVERRLASGYSLEDAEAIAAGEPAWQQADDDDS